MPFLISYHIHAVIGVNVHIKHGQPLAKSSGLGSLQTSGLHMMSVMSSFMQVAANQKKSGV